MIILVNMRQLVFHLLRGKALKACHRWKAAIDRRLVMRPGFFDKQSQAQKTTVRPARMSCALKVHLRVEGKEFLREC